MSEARPARPWDDFAHDELLMLIDQILHNTLRDVDEQDLLSVKWRAASAKASALEAVQSQAFAAYHAAFTAQQRVVGFGQAFLRGKKTRAAAYRTWQTAERKATRQRVLDDAAWQALQASWANPQVPA